MEKTIYNLVRNSIDYDIGEYFVNEIIKQMNNDEILKLARAELKLIKLFLLPPDKKELENRLIQRNQDNIEIISKRLPINYNL